MFVMANFMPNKIWIFNLDDFLFKSNSMKALRQHSLKYIQLLKKGDYCVASPLVQRDPDFLDYMARIKQIDYPNWILYPKSHQENQSLISSILNDEELIHILTKKCQEGYILVPLIYSKEFEKINKVCRNTLFNNAHAVAEANNKLLFKDLCKKFQITTFAPIYEIPKNQKGRVLQPLNFSETYLLRRPFSAGGYGNTRGTLKELLPLIKKYTKETDLYIERYKDISKTIGTLVVLKDSEFNYIGMDCQIIHKEAWEGCFFPFTKLQKRLLDQIREKTMLLASYYYGMGVRGQINFDWAIRNVDGELKIRALECNSRYNGFGLCLRLASTVYNIPKNQLHFYLDTKMKFNPIWTTKKIISLIDNINSNLPFKGGVVLTTGVENGKAGFCFITTNRKDLADLRREFKRKITKSI